MRKRGGYQYILMVLVCSLALFGAVLVYSSSAFVAIAKKRETIAFLIRQLLSCGVGFAALFVFWRLDYMQLQKLGKFLILVTILFLLIVLLLPASSSRGGVKRYIHMFGVNMIPSEFAKLGLILYLASAFARKQKLMDDFWEGPFPQLFVLALVCGLVFLQPSHTSAIFLGMLGLAVWFFAGADRKHLTVLATLFVLLSVFFICKHPYALRRMDLFLKSFWNPLSRENYHLSQATMSMVNGGLFGVGLGKSQQVLHYLPEPHTDFLWAVLAEELGLIRSLGLLFFYFVIVFVGYLTALGSRDDFARLAAAGITTWFALQTMMHLCVVTGLMPTTGVALPLMSYGGSSLVAMLAGIGVLMSISRYAGHFELEGR